MNSFYMDASALAKRYVPEAGSPLMDQLFINCPPRRMMMFNVGVGEVVSLLVRKRNSGQITQADFVQALHDFDAEVVTQKALRKIVAKNDLVTAALLFIPVHSINATDAIILRSALDLAATYRAKGNDLVLVASDQRLLKAAQAEGLATFAPETQDQAALSALL